MNNFQINISAVRSAGEKYQATGEGVGNRAASIDSPSPMMMGIFFSPFLAAALPPLTGMLKGSIAGSGHGYSTMGDQLVASAQAYQDQEDRACTLIASITKAVNS